MIDMFGVQDGDILLLNSQVPKAKNVLDVQLASLEYLITWGVDLEFFLSEEFQFQTASFKSYLVSRLSESLIDVASLSENIENLFTEFNFQLSGSVDTNPGLVR